MIEVGPISCCSHPEALVVIAAVPLCQAEMLQGMLAEEFFAASSGEEADDMLCDSGVFGADWFDDQQFLDYLPLRCACVMDCRDAIGLMQEVGHVVL